MNFLRKKMIKELLENKITKNAGWIIAGKIGQMAINFLAGLLTARYLGPSNFGLISYAAAYTGFFASVCNLGINSVILREFAENPGEEGKILGTSMGLRAFSSFLSAAAITALGFLINPEDELASAVVALSSLGLIFEISGLFAYWFQSKLESKISALAAFLAYAITACYKIFLIVTGKSVLFFALAASVDYIFAGIFLFIAYKRNGGGKLFFSADYAKYILDKSKHFILPGVMVAVYSQTDKIMLREFFGETETGFYSIAFSLSAVWCFVLSAAIDSFHPSIVESAGNEELFGKMNRRLYAIVFWLSVSVSVFFCIFGEPIIKILYGEAFLPAVKILRIITWQTAFSYLGVARNAWIVCKNRQKKLVLVYFFSAVGNVLLNFLLIPPFGGAGAAAASVAAQIFSSVLVPVFVADFRENAELIGNAILLKDLK